MQYSSKTLNLLIRLLRAIPKRSQLFFLSLIPLSFLNGIAEVCVLALTSRLFSIIAGLENPPLPFSSLFPSDPQIKIVSLIIIFIGIAIYGLTIGDFTKIQIGAIFFIGVLISILFYMLFFLLNVALVLALKTSPKIQFWGQSNFLLLSL